MGDFNFRHFGRSSAWAPNNPGIDNPLGIGFISQYITRESGMPLRGEKMKNFLELIRGCLTNVTEIMPWDLEQRLTENPDLLIVDVREPDEYAAMHIAGSLNVPRGILESACEWDYEETIPELVRAREREVVLVCRSGYRSVLAASSMQVLGYRQVASLQTGLRGWKDYEQPLVDAAGSDVDLDDADIYFTPKLRPEQRKPASAPVAT